MRGRKTQHLVRAEPNLSCGGGLRALKARLREQRGLTIVELLVGMLIAIVVSFAVLAVLSSTTGVFDSQTVRMQNQDDARTAINQMARYIRMATSSADNVSSQSNAIATALPQDIELFCDVDGDGTAEKIRYYLEGSVLMSQAADPAWIETPDPHWEYAEYETDGVVIENTVRNGTEPVFTYYRNIGGALEAFTPSNETERREIVTVALTVRVNERPDLAAGDVGLETQVQIRQRYEGELQ